MPTRWRLRKCRWSYHPFLSKILRRPRDRGRIMLSIWRGWRMCSQLSLTNNHPLKPSVRMRFLWYVCSHSAVLWGEESWRRMRRWSRRLRWPSRTIRADWETLETSAEMKSTHYRHGSGWIVSLTRPKNVDATFLLGLGKSGKSDREYLLLKLVPRLKLGLQPTEAWELADPPSSSVAIVSLTITVQTKYEEQITGAVVAWQRYH